MEYVPLLGIFFAYLITAIGLGQGLLEAIAWGLVIIAVFGWRTRQQKIESVA